MQCKYCGVSYKLTKWHTDPKACPDCDGFTEDLSIDDDELHVEVWNLRKIKASIPYDLETDDI